MLRASLAVLLAAAILPADARTLDLDNPADVITAMRKIACSTVDGEPASYWWSGRAFSRRQGEKDRVLFNVEGMNIRACISDEHPERGKGYRHVSRELLLYRDPKTNEVLSTWENPWTGETVEVMHVANDPVNFQAYEKGPNGQPISWSGQIVENMWRQTNTVPLFYPNPLASAYQKEIGGTYHATEMFNFFGEAEDLLDANKTTAGVQIGWVRMSDWLPWMKMQGREGIIYMHTAGRKLSSFDAMPDTMKEEIARYYPDYNKPPPLNDARKNVTSWEYYRRVREGEEKLPKRD